MANVSWMAPRLGVRTPRTEQPAAPPSVLLLAVLLRIQIGLASRFLPPGHGDPYSGRSLRCHRYPRMFGGRRPYEASVAAGCAHRTLPCGNRLLVWDLRTRRGTTCIVVDRGPYGARLPGGGWTVKRRPQDPGRWLGVVDLLPGPAAELQLRGKHPVAVIPLAASDGPW